MKKFIRTFLALFLMGMMLVPATGTFAQTNSKTPAKKATTTSSTGALGGIQGQLKEFGNTSYGSNAQTSPQIVVARIIRAALGLLGTLLVIYMVYGGMMWMTSNGESSKVDKAKGILRQAIVGMIIVISAYAISSFVVSTLLTGVTNTPLTK